MSQGPLCQLNRLRKKFLRQKIADCSSVGLRLLVADDYTSAKLFNARWRPDSVEMVEAWWKKAKPSRLLFADDLVLLSSTESGLQRALNSFADACKTAGIVIVIAFYSPSCLGQETAK